MSPESHRLSNHMWARTRAAAWLSVVVSTAFSSARASAIRFTGFLFWGFIFAPLFKVPAVPPHYLRRSGEEVRAQHFGVMAQHFGVMAQHFGVMAQHVAVIRKRFNDSVPELAKAYARARVAVRFRIQVIPRGIGGKKTPPEGGVSYGSGFTWFSWPVSSPAL